MNDKSKYMSTEETERITGRSLNERWRVGASHALYREDGAWYHMLKRFPGALFDRDGYILFKTEQEFLNYASIEANRDTNQVHIIGGISKLTDYVKKVEVIVDDSDTGDTPEDEGIAQYDMGAADELDIREDNHSVFEWVRKLERKLIVTDPDFQRNVVWKPSQKSLFIESILLNVPIAPIYVNQTIKGGYILVDGLQRTTTLNEFIKDGFALRKLRILRELEGKHFSELDAGRQTKIEDRKLLVFVIKPSAPLSAVYDIFYRINTGGTQLNRQEIRNCLYAGASTRLVKVLAESQEFLKATDRGFSPMRMKDREAVLRCIAFTEFDYERDYSGSMDDFLGTVMNHLNLREADRSYLTQIQQCFARVMKLTFDIFGTNSFRPTSDGRARINIALMEAVYRFFATHPNDRKLLRDKKLLVSNYKRLCSNPEFADAIQRATGDRQRVLTRFRLTEQILGES